MTWHATHCQAPPRMRSPLLYTVLPGPNAVPAGDVPPDHGALLAPLAPGLAPPPPRSRFAASFDFAREAARIRRCGAGGYPTLPYPGLPLLFLQASVAMRAWLATNPRILRPVLESAASQSQCPREAAVHSHCR